MADSSRARLLHRQAAVAAVKAWGELVLGEAQRLAPIREGTLRASGELDVDVLGTTVTAEISFNEIYAARQHEETDWAHPLGGQAKYLEGPVQRHAATGQRLLELELRRRGLL